MFTEQIHDFFNPDEFGDVATLGVLPGFVLYDENGLVVQEFGVQSAGPTVLFSAVQWPAAAIGDILGVRGGTFRVRSVTAIDDGALVLAELAKIT